MPFEKNSWYYTFTLSKRLPDKTVTITRSTKKLKHTGND